jgi:hypothetical protein
VSPYFTAAVLGTSIMSSVIHSFSFNSCNIVKNSLDKFVDKFPRMRRLKNKDGRLDATLDDIN